MNLLKHACQLSPCHIYQTKKLEMNKLGEGATGRHHEFMIVIEVNVQKVPISLMEVNKIL